VLLGMQLELGIASAMVNSVQLATLDCGLERVVRVGRWC